MKKTNWVVLETKNLNLPTIHGFLRDDGTLIIENDDGLKILTNENVGLADFARDANCLHVYGPEEYAGSWSYSGENDKTRGDWNTPYPLVFRKVSS